MDTTFTAGPWTYVRDMDYWRIDPTEIGGKDNREGNEADYHLIAAAPDLLAACEAALVHVGDPADWNMKARPLLQAAIAKARA